MLEQETVLLLTGNLFLIPSIKTAAAASGLTAASVSDVDKLMEATDLGNVPLVLIDLDMEEQVWTVALAKLRSKNPPRPFIISSGPGRNTEALSKARQMGSDAVMIRRAFFSSLQELMKSRGQSALD